MESIDLGRGKSDTEIRTLILDAYAARGWEPPSDFGWVSRFMSAATAKRGRSLRLVVESGRAFRSARRWLRDPGNHAYEGQHD